MAAAQDAQVLWRREELTSGSEHPQAADGRRSKPLPEPADILHHEVPQGKLINLKHIYQTE